MSPTTTLRRRTSRSIRCKTLAAQIEALDGFTVLAISGDPDAEPDDQLVVRFDHSAVGLERLADFDDGTHQFLAQLAAAAELDGSLDYTADLHLDLILGLDASGFFVRGDSSIRLDLSADGSVASSFDLQVSGVGSEYAAEQPGKRRF
jgi:hypothetical protein